MRLDIESTEKTEEGIGSRNTNRNGNGNGNASVGSEKAASTLVQHEPEPEPAVDVPPNGGYGWVVVLSICLINAHTWGINSSYGVFLAHYLSHNTFPGATPLAYAFVGGLSISLALIVAPVATVFVGRFGTHPTLAIGIVLQTGGLLGASWASRIWHLFLTQGVAFGFGMGFLFVASVGLISQWFTTRRSFANSLAVAGGGIGGLVYSLATNAMIQSVGLGWAFRVLAIVSCAVNIVCTVLIRDRNKAVGSVQMAFDRQLFKRLDFLLLLGWGFFSMLGYIVLLFSLPSYARSIGLSASQGSVVGALLNLGQGIGRPLVGYFSDSFGRINMAATGTFLTALFCFVIWIFATSYGVLIFFAMIVGTVAGTFWATVGPVGAEVVGIKILPTALSIMWLALVLPCTFSMPIGLELRRESGDIFLDAQIYAGCMYLGAVACMLGLRAWKIGELERETEKMGERVGEREGEMKDDDQVVRSDLARQPRRGSLKSAIKAANRLWSWQKV